ncbi:hypothetical protein AB0A74_23020 [Saccharothrix sp. NPDC042600]|nr:hypothetical protein GCM10017745_16030 [Saccharothrix mutabilis subsp. capreolus]
MKLKVEFTAHCSTPDMLRAVRGVVLVLVVVLVVLVTGEALPIGQWVR